MIVLSRGLSSEDIVKNGVAGLAGSAGGFNKDDVYAVSRGGLESDFAPGSGEGAGDSDAAQLRHDAGQDMAQGVVGFLQAFDFGLQFDIFVTDPQILGQKEVMVKHMISPFRFYTESGSRRDPFRSSSRRTAEDS